MLWFLRDTIESLIYRGNNSSNFEHNGYQDTATFAFTWEEDWPVGAYISFFFFFFLLLKAFNSCCLLYLPADWWNYPCRAGETPALLYRLLARRRKLWGYDTGCELNCMTKPQIFPHLLYVSCSGILGAGFADLECQSPTPATMCVSNCTRCVTYITVCVRDVCHW